MTSFEFHKLLKESVLKTLCNQFGELNNINYVLLKEGKIKSGFVSYTNFNDIVTLRLFTLVNNKLTISEEVYKNDIELYINNRKIKRLTTD